MLIQTAYLEITNRCNLNCSTCFNRSGLSKETKELSAAQIVHIIELLIPFGLKRVLLSGGEPVLNTDFNKILELTDQYPDLSFGVVTNGTIHHEKLIQYVNTRPNLTLQISLDGSCEEINAKTRGLGHFQETLAFAQKVHPKHTTPLLKMVVSQNNLTDIEDFCSLTRSLGFLAEFAFINRSGNAADSWENKELTPQQKLQVLNRVKEINQQYQTDIFLPLCTSSCPLSTESPALSISIKTDGSIQPCQSLYDETFCLGNIFSFDEELFVHRTKALCQLAHTRTTRDYQCHKCLLNSTCGRGCMAEAFYMHQDPLANDEGCAFRKLQLLFSQIKL